ncbi:MAG: hypothetical protein ABIG32_02880 [Candidatus Uhrbacteria bacterium]|nr:hypothetical protein [Patescibacteria group bacterium]
MMRLDKLPNAKPGEKTILFLRRHWFIPLRIVLILLVLLVVPIVGYFIIMAEMPWVLEHNIVTPLQVLGVSLYYLIIWVYSFSEFIDYYLDIWIVTNERIINIEQLGLFARTASELNLTAVQDVTSDVRGITHTFFDYGIVHVQTAAETTRFIFKQVPHPEIIKRQIIQLSDQSRAKQREAAAEKIGQASPEIKKIEI